MDKNFEYSLTRTLGHEGGWSEHPNDPGGATMRGVTLSTFREFYNNSGLTKDDLRDITLDQLREIYRTNYWDKCGCDKLPSGLDYAVFDAAVNSGPTRAVKWLQQLLQVDIDGILGPVTTKYAKETYSNNPLLIYEYCALRLKYLQMLKNWIIFGKGWSSRILSVCAVGIIMRK